jgi:ribokinase
MMDLVARAQRLPQDGETIMGNCFQRFPGGKGANQAVAAARLGANVTMVGKLGRDGFGQEMLETLRGEDINCDHILLDDKAATGVGFVTIDDSGTNRIIVIPGANMCYRPEDLLRVETIICESDILVMQMEIDMEVIQKALTIATNAGVPVLLNPAPARPLSEEILQNITYLTPNETEAEFLSGIEIVDAETASKAAQLLLAKGVKNVIITLGEHGALVANDSGIEHVPGFSANSVDTVAAGDAFNGALAVAIVEGRTLLDGALFANAAGALTVQKHGAIPSLPSRSEVESLLAENQQRLA